MHKGNAGRTKWPGSRKTSDASEKFRVFWCARKLLSGPAPRAERPPEQRR
jgi:hypothetical protein